MIKIIIQSGCIVGSLLLTSCSLFPDKETRYLQNSELSPLELPADLRQNPADASVPDAEQNRLSAETSKKNGNRPNVILASQNETPLFVDIEKEPLHIEIFADFNQTWRTVGKTLAHMGLEVLDSDEDTGQYFVVYEEASKPVKESFWSFLTFWRDGSEHEEYDFRVKLLADHDSTKVFIMDAQGEPVVDGPGRELLQEIYKALYVFS
jgi:uncharacterized lipoprotein